MTKPYFWIVLVILLFNLIAFQNCGKVANSQFDSASSSNLYSEPEMQAKQIIVKMKDDESNERLHAWAGDNGLMDMNAGDPTALQNWRDMGLSHWSWDGDMNVDEVKALLMQSSMASKMEYAEPNYMYQASVARPIANIPLEQQRLTSANIMLAELSTNLTPLVSAANPIERERPVVAIIDSGVDTTHLAFVRTDALWKNPGESGLDGGGNPKESNSFDDDGNGYTDDVYGFNFLDKNSDVSDSTGHGTHCAGIALGVGQNIFDLNVNTSVNPERKSKVQIMVLKFIGPNGGSTADAINAVFYATNKGASVMSNSWGGGSYSRALEDAIAYAYDREVLFVAAAGNSDSDNNTKPVYPAGYRVPNVVSVAATDSSDNLANFSNYGTASVDIAAPGVSILSTYPKTPSGTPNMYEYLSGTSMATPFVSGVAALMVYENDLLKAHQIKELLISQGDQVAGLTEKLKNPKRLNANFSVVQASITPQATTKPVYAGRSPASSASEEQQTKAGCGLVKAGGAPPPSGPSQMILISLLMLPLMFALRFRQREI